jgi:hypothetical protein
MVWGLLWRSLWDACVDCKLKGGCNAEGLVWKGVAGICSLLSKLGVFFVSVEIGIGVSGIG